MGGATYNGGDNGCSPLLTQKMSDTLHLSHGLELVRELLLLLPLDLRVTARDEVRGTDAPKQCLFPPAPPLLPQCALVESLLTSMQG